MDQISHEKFAEKFANRIVWNVGMISKMLQNETYTGTLVQGKYDCDGKRHTMLPKEQWIRHKDAHPAIVSREQFETVQELWKKTALKYERGKREPLPENRYAGKIFCTRCGKAAARVNGGSTNILFYYRCRDCDDDLKAELGLKRLPKLPLAVLDDIVMHDVQAQMDSLINNDRFIAELTRSEAFHLKQSELTRERAKWEKTASGMDKALSTAYTHHLDGLLDYREFELVRAQTERLEVTVKLARAESKLKQYGDMSTRHSHWRKVYGRLVLWWAGK